MNLAADLRGLATAITSLPIKLRLIELATEADHLQESLNTMKRSLSAIRIECDLCLVPEVAR